MKYKQNKRFKRQQLIYKIEFFFQGIISLIKCFSFDSKERNIKYERFKHFYIEDNFRHLNKNSNSIGEVFYMSPFAIITSDVIPANELYALRKGIIKLLKNHHSNHRS